MWCLDSSTLSRHVPLLLVFLSGLGFSLQTLMVKLLSMNGYNGSFSLVLSRGICQLVICSWLVFVDKDRREGKGPPLFGPSVYVKKMLFLRSVIGFGGIAFAFLSAERLPVGDSSALTMMSPIFAAVMGIFVLNEPWRLPEFAASVTAITGAFLVARPSFLFGGSVDGLGVLMALMGAVTAAGAFVCIRILGTSAKMPYANVST
jgi:drug/metabolite transporter (DMT)-like permease